jgi:hypothetical protein
VQRCIAGTPASGKNEHGVGNVKHARNRSRASEWMSMWWKQLPQVASSTHASQTGACAKSTRRQTQGRSYRRSEVMANQNNREERGGNRQEAGSNREERGGSSNREDRGGNR